MQPTAQQISNRQLAAGGVAQQDSAAPAFARGGAVPPVSSNDQAARSLSDYLQSGSLSGQEQGYEGGIMDRYQQAAQNTQSAYKDEYGSISADYANQLDQLHRDVSQQQTGEQESRTGFATNTAIMRNLQETGENRIATLENAKQEALLHNNSDMANSLNSLIMNEQQMITDARKSYVSNLSAASTLQTPQQQQDMAIQQQQRQATVQLQQLAPDAGITSADGYDQAVAKFRNSHYYKNNQSQAEAQIQQALAAASASSASAGVSGAQRSLIQAQTGIQNQELGLLGNLSGSSGGQYGLLSTPSQSTDARSLLDGSATADTLHSKYDSLPDGIGGLLVANGLNQAQQQGYNPQQASLSAAGAAEAARAANSGSPLATATIAGSGIFQNALTRLGFGSTPSRSLAPAKTIQLKAGNSAGLPAGTYAVDASGNLSPQ